MPNIIFKVGSVDLSSFVRVNPDQKMSPSPGDVFEPAFSDSPLFEGQTLTSLHAKNKEMAWPLYVHNAGAGAVAVTNLVSNPNFQWDQAGTIGAGWSTSTPSWFLNSGSTCAVRTDSTSPTPGGRAQKIITTNASTQQGAAISLGVLPAGTYTASAYVRGNVGGEVVQLFAGIVSPGTGDGSQGLTCTTNYQRITTTFTSDGVTTSHMGVRTTGATASTFFMTGAMVTSGNAVTAYGDGDSPGWAWQAGSGTSNSNNLIGQDGLNQLIQKINQALRPVVDLGQTVYCQWQNAQASNPTFFTVQFGRFEPDFNFRTAEKGWMGGILHLWVLPYGHTATERAVGSWSAPTAQSGVVIPAASIVKGALRTVPQVGATNLLPNPSFEYDASGAVPAGWSAVSDGFYTSSGASCAAAPSGFAGTQSMRIFGATSGVNTGVNAWIAGPFAPSVTYAAQVMMRGASGGESIAMGIDSSASRGDFNFVTAVLGTQWQNVAVPWTPSGVAATAGLWIRSQTPTGITIWADAGIVSTPSNGFFDGDTAAGFWGATPGFSYSALAPTSAYAVAGDVSPQFDLRVTVGSYLGDDGRVGIMTALPQASYAPIIPVGSFLGLNPSAIIYGASGAWASQFLAFDNTGGSQGAAAVGSGVNQGYFSFALSPASVYAGDNRVLGLVRARQQPFGLRAFDPQGIPLGPTAIASALDGWQVIDYGVLRLPPWQSTALIRVEAYSGIPYSASGMFSPERAAPGWTKEHGPIFVIPNGNSVLDLDWNSQTLTMDGFEGASGIGAAQDQLGNTWQATGAQNVGQFGAFFFSYTGNSQLYLGLPTPTIGVLLSYGSGMLNQDHEIEAVFTVATGYPPIGQGTQAFGVGRYSASLAQPNDTAAIVTFGATVTAANVLAVYGNGGSLVASTVLSPTGLNLGGRYHIRLVSRGSQVWANLASPSGIANSGSGAVASLGGAQIAQQATNILLYPALLIRNPGMPSPPLCESFRARILASQGYLPRDILHLHQPLNQNTRMTPSALDVSDMQARQRGPVGALSLPVPSLGAGLFVASFPWDQGPANDLLNVDVRIRERFTYAR